MQQTANFLNVVYENQKAQKEAEESQKKLSEFASRISRTSEIFFENVERDSQIRRNTGIVFLLDQVVSSLAEGKTRAHIMMFEWGEAKPQVSNLKGVYKAVFEKLTALKVNPFIDEVKNSDAPNGAYWYISILSSEIVVTHLWDLYRDAVKDGTEPALVE